MDRSLFFSMNDTRVVLFEVELFFDRSNCHGITVKNFYRNEFLGGFEKSKLSSVLSLYTRGQVESNCGCNLSRARRIWKVEECRSNRKWPNKKARKKIPRHICRVPFKELSPFEKDKSIHLKRKWKNGQWIGGFRSKTESNVKLRNHLFLCSINSSWKINCKNDWRSGIKESFISEYFYSPFLYWWCLICLKKHELYLHSAHYNFGTVS